MITITGMDTDMDMVMVAVSEDTAITEKLRVMVITVGLYYKRLSRIFN